MNEPWEIVIVAEVADDRLVDLPAILGVTLDVYAELGLIVGDAGWVAYPTRLTPGEVAR